VTDFADDPDEARRYERLSHRFSWRKGYVKLRLSVFEIGMGSMENGVAVLDDEPLSNAGCLDMGDETAVRVIQLIDCLPLDRTSLGNSL
jgi:hypothetical protein